MKRLIPLTIALLAIPVLSAHAADGKALYKEHCAKCHGLDGKGKTFMGKKYGAKDYTDPKVQEALKDEQIAKVIKEGYKDQAGKEVMKPSDDYSKDDIAALVDYMRKFKK